MTIGDASLRDTHPIFPVGARVTIVQMRGPGNSGKFGVAMRDWPRVTPLPRGYDGMTTVRWINGYVIAVHPAGAAGGMPPLLVDLKADRVTRISMETFEQIKRDVRAAYNLSKSTRIIH